MRRQFKATYRGLICKASTGEESDLLGLARTEDPFNCFIIAQELEYLCNKRTSIRYWISDKPGTDEEIQESALKEIFGLADVRFGAHYSEITGYLWTDEELNVGGHNLIDELKSHLGKFIILEVAHG